MIIEAVIHSLVPTWWEVQVSVAAAAFVVAAYWFFTSIGGQEGAAGDRSTAESTDIAGDGTEDRNKVIFVILVVCYDDCLVLLFCVSY